MKNDTIITIWQSCCKDDGEVLLCGGLDLEEADRCISFDGASWTALPTNSNEKHCYYDTPNVMTSEGWWVTGRKQTSSIGDCSGTTSEIYTGEEWIPGPALPTSQYSIFSCVASLSANQIMITGGKETPKNGFIYDLSTSEWEETSSITNGRYGHGCVSLGEQGVLIAGGYNDERSVELYDPVDGSWSTNLDLPQTVDTRWPILLNREGEVLALFYGESVIYRRSKEDGSWSVLEGVELPSEDTGYWPGLAVLVPDDFAQDACL